MAGRARKTEQDQTQSDHEQGWDDEVIDYHRGLRGRQYICRTCNSRPCMDSCLTQFCPDSLHRKMSRAGVGLPGRMTPADWALTHAEWLAGVVAGTVEAHTALRAEVQEFVDRLMVPAREPDERAPRERSIPVAAAMEQVMAVMAGRVPAEDVAPPYAESVP